MAELSADEPWPGEGQTFEDRFYGQFRPPLDREAEIKSYLIQRYKLSEENINQILEAARELLTD